MFSHLVVFEMHTSTVATVVKHSVQKWSLMLNRNYSYIKSLYNILHGGNDIGNFIGSILTVQCHVKQWFTAQKQNYIPRSWCWTKRILKERCTDWRKTSWHWCSIRSKLKQIIPSFGSSVWFGRKYSWCWYKVSKVMALWNYCCTQYFAFRL
jgi:hypothetical protein